MPPSLGGNRRPGNGSSTPAHVTRSPAKPRPATPRCHGARVWWRRTRTGYRRRRAASTCRSARRWSCTGYPSRPGRSAGHRPRCAATPATPWRGSRVHRVAPSARVGASRSWQRATNRPRLAAELQMPLWPSLLPFPFRAHRQQHLFVRTYPKPFCTKVSTPGLYSSRQLSGACRAARL